MVKLIPTKETLVKAAGLGLGSAAANVVKSKVLATQKPIIQDTVPALVGLVLMSQSGIVGGIGGGMVANSLGGLITKNVPGLSGTDAVMMGEVYEQSLTDAGSNGVLMGEAQDMPDYTSSSYDFTSSDAGEINY
jgi:hypothetical protein